MSYPNVVSLGEVTLAEDFNLSFCAYVRVNNRSAPRLHNSSLLEDWPRLSMTMLRGGDERTLSNFRPGAVAAMVEITTMGRSPRWTGTISTAKPYPGSRRITLDGRLC